MAARAGTPRNAQLYCLARPAYASVGRAAAQKRIPPGPEGLRRDWWSTQKSRPTLIGGLARRSRRGIRRRLLLRLLLGLLGRPRLGPQHALFEHAADLRQRLVLD